MKELLAELWVANRAALRHTMFPRFNDTHHVLLELNGRIVLLISASEMCSNLKRRTYSNRGRRPTVFNDVSVYVVICIEYFVQNVYRACAYGEINLMKNMIYNVECVELWFLFVFSNYLPAVVIKEGSAHTWTRISHSIKTTDGWSQSYTCGLLVQVPVCHVDALKPIKPSRSHFNVVGGHYQATYQNHTM